VKVSFVLQNNSPNQTTSGLIHGTAMHSILRPINQSWWFRPPAVVTNLAPGQALNGILEFSQWSEDCLPVEVDISLAYWVEDPTGTITFFALNAPGQDKTYKAVSFAQTSIGIPISCANHILPLFNHTDIQAMANQPKYKLDLTSCSDIASHAIDI